MQLSVVRFTFAVAFTTSQHAARAENLQIPEGGKAVPVGKDCVICGELPEGWTTAANRRAVRPPETASATNRAVEVSIATSPGGCARPPARLTLLATGPVPELDAASVSFSPDDGRLHFKWYSSRRCSNHRTSGNTDGSRNVPRADPSGEDSTLRGLAAMKAPGEYRASLVAGAR